jgi:hypothetical protein
MEPLDGNAIGGLLIDVFGEEMTNAMATCAGCGALRPVAELQVFLRGPGVVARCRTCSSALMVFVTVRSTTCVDLQGLADLRMP